MITNNNTISLNYGGQMELPGMVNYLLSLIQL